MRIVDFLVAGPILRCSVLNGFEVGPADRPPIKGWGHVQTVDHKEGKRVGGIASSPSHDVSVQQPVRVCSSMSVPRGSLCSICAVEQFRNDLVHALILPEENSNDPTTNRALR